jgi:hypothetical protein
MIQWEMSLTRNAAAAKVSHGGRTDVFTISIAR